jgi:hypothetical protein
MYSTYDLRRTLRLLEEAIARDPYYGPALGLAAQCCQHLATNFNSPDRDAFRPKGVGFARRAIEVAEDDPGVLANAAMALAVLGEDLDAMIALVDRALAFNPSYAGAYQRFSQTLGWPNGSCNRAWRDGLAPQPTRAGERGGVPDRYRPVDLAAACSFAATSGGPDNKARRGRGTEGSNPSPSSRESDELPPEQRGSCYS